jgi:hypothetical protein
MPVWSIASVVSRPTVTLTSWQAFDVQLPGLDEQWTRHFVGYAFEDRQGQVSSPVLTFSPAECRGITRSGRVYLLAGRPGADGDGEYVWNQWKSRWRVSPKAARDVTSEVWALICSEGAK